MDAYGHGVAVDLADLSKLTKLKLHEFTQEKFRHMCILSGCDYLPSIKGIGLQTAIKLLRKSSSVHKVGLAIWSLVVAWVYEQSTASSLSFALKIQREEHKHCVVTSSSMLKLLLYT